ncbi:hypothetical protein MASR1M12_35030 [Erysipelotrichia bacterium]
MVISRQTGPHKTELNADGSKDGQSAAIEPTELNVIAPSRAGRLLNSGEPSRPRTVSVSPKELLAET